jgi:hypothetical protein
MIDTHGCNHRRVRTHTFHKHERGFSSGDRSLLPPRCPTMLRLPRVLWRCLLAGSHSMGRFASFTDAPVDMFARANDAVLAMQVRH